MVLDLYCILWFHLFLRIIGIFFRLYVLLLGLDYLVCTRIGNLLGGVYIPYIDRNFLLKVKQNHIILVYYHLLFVPFFRNFGKIVGFLLIIRGKFCYERWRYQADIWSDNFYWKCTLGYLIRYLFNRFCHSILWFLMKF